MRQLQGKVAVLTGASSGIGRATAGTLAGAGMQVVAVARRSERLASLAREVPGVTPHVADVTRLEAVGDLHRFVSDTFGACHVLINNAGASYAKTFAGEDQRLDVEREIALNYVAPMRLMAAFAGLLRHSRPARVINVASVAGRMPVIGPGYSAGKAALIALSEATHLTWPDDGVTVSQVNPGLILTEGFPQTDFMRTPIRRLIGEPDDVAEAIRQVAITGARERTVPRWYRAAYLLRHLAPPLYFAAARRVRDRRP